MKKLNLLEIAKNIKERDVYETFSEEDLTEEYPENFDFKELKNINSYAGKKKYIEERLGRPIGSGSARSVYRVDETKVLKLAKNAKGLAQNNSEIGFYNEPYFDDIIARVIDFDEDDEYWVEMELARKVSINDFKRLWGVNFNDLYQYLMVVFGENNPRRRSGFGISKEIREELNENEHIQSLVDVMLQTDLEPGDLAKKNSWGLVKREDGEYLVLVDFGFTTTVAKTHYK